MSINKYKMKSYLGYAAFILLSLAMVISGCSKKNNNNPVSASSSQNLSFMMNGSGFNNQKFSIDTKNIGGAYYYGAANYTEVAASGSSGGSDITLLLYFSGSGTGNFNWDTTSKKNELALTIGNKTYIGIPGKGSTNISQYGKVGSTVEGTFSGKLVSYTAASLDTVTISNGNFSVIRVNSQPVP